MYPDINSRYLKMIYFYENVSIDEDGRQIDVSSYVGESIFDWLERHGRLMGRESDVSRPFVILSMRQLAKMRNEKLAFKKKDQANFDAAKTTLKNKWVVEVQNNVVKKSAAAIAKVAKKSPASAKSFGKTNRL